MYIFQKNMLCLYIKYIYMQYKFWMRLITINCLAAQKMMYMRYCESGERGNTLWLFQT